MKNVFLVTIAMLSILAVSMVPQAFSFCIPPNPAYDDGKYEIFGPHVNGIKTFVYANYADMFTGMDTGQMDIEDWAIDAAHAASWSTANGPITLQNYGSEPGYYIIDINNNATYTPADNVSGTYNPTSNLALRQAIAACVNRSCIESFTGGFALPMYTPVPNYMGAYINTQIAPGQPLAALTYGGYTGNLTLANQILDANGFPWNGNHTVRLDTHNGNTTLNLIFYSRIGDRQTLGDHLNAALNTVGIGTTYYSGVPRANVTGPVFAQQYFNLYTGGWTGIGPDPDYLCDLYNGSNYYHPGSPLNYDAINYPETNQNATTIKLTPDLATATQAAKDFQYWFAHYAAAVPVFCYTGFKGYKNVPHETSTSMSPVTYPPTGDWKHLVNQETIGVNNWWSKLDMQTYGNLYPNLTTWYGFSSTVTLQNIVYAQWYWDLEVLGVIYDVGWARDPYTLQWGVPQLFENYTIGTWTDPVTSEKKTSVTITLRPDAYWQDGQPVTIADVYYTLLEISNDLLAKGFPPPSWYPTVQYMQSVEILDDYHIQVLLNVYSVWAAGWVIGSTIIPKHIWKPIVDASTLANPIVQGNTPDANIIGTGPFRWVSGTGISVGDTIVMVANTPGSVVHGITSPGYYLYYPVMATINTPNYATKINVAGQTPISVPVTLALRNLWTDGSLVVNKYVYVNGVLQPSYPVSRTLAPVSPYPMGTSDVETLNLTLAVPSLTYVKLAARITGPNPLNYTEAWNTTTISYSVSNPWLSQWINVTLPIWVNMYADKMSVNPSIMSPTNDETIGSRFNVTVSLSMAENVFAWQTAMHYNRTQLMCTRAAVTSYPSSQYMIGHETIVGAAIDGGAYGNGSVLVAEHCVGNDFVSGPHEGTLFWAEFQILQTPGTNQSLNSMLDISTEYAPGGTFVMGSSLNELAFTQSDGVYNFVGPIVISTPTGSNVTVTPAQNVNITFANVTTEGSTTVSSVQPPTSQFVSVACSQITTNASYTGNITLEFGYDPSGLSLQDQQAMKIWLWNDSASSWVDVTTYVNTTSHVVYGMSPHLSMFGVTSNLGITGDLDVQGTTTVSIPSTNPAPPHGLAGLNYYQINTTKILSPPINLSLAYNYGNIPPEEQIFTQMWMWNESSASWVDITTGVNTAGHTVYGSAPHLSMFGVTSLPQPPYGVMVASANCPKTVVCQGYGANINVTIRNQGGSPQTNFNVSLYCNTTLLPTTYQIVELDPGAQETLNFTWNTNASWVISNYSISAFSQRIGWIYVARVGDISTDNKVDGRDLIIASRAFGTYGPDYFYPGSPATVGWNANADVNNDNKVDGRDLIIMSRHFGEGT
jgi:ABC-type transport system substrate-binding protein